jgi:hypothetical protein
VESSATGLRTIVRRFEAEVSSVTGLARGPVASTISRRVGLGVLLLMAGICFASLPGAEGEWRRALFAIGATYLIALYAAATGRLGGGCLASGIGLAVVIAAGTSLLEGIRELPLLLGAVHALLLQSLFHDWTSAPEDYRARIDRSASLAAAALVLLVVIAQIPRQSYSSTLTALGLSGIALAIHAIRRGRTWGLLVVPVGGMGALAGSWPLLPNTPPPGWLGLSSPAFALLALFACVLAIGAWLPFLPGRRLKAPDT